MDGSWDDTSIFVVLLIVSSLHGEGFSCACLTICEDSSIITFKHTLQNRQGSFLEDRFLEAIHAKGGIEGKVSGWWDITLFWMWVLNGDFTVGLIDMDD